MEPIPVVGYARVSTEEQKAYGLSVAAQIPEIERYCAANNLRLVCPVVTDPGVSAGIPIAERPGGAKVVELVRTQQVKAVVATKLDRLFRSVVDGLLTVKDWMEKGVAVKVGDFPDLDPSDPTKEMVLTMQLGFAQYERRLASTRTKTTFAYRKARGLVVGHAPYGYDVEEGTGKLIPNPQEQAVIQAVYLLAQNPGNTFREIARQLNAEGVPTKRGQTKKGPTLWQTQTVIDIYRRAERLMQAAKNEKEPGQ